MSSQSQNKTNKRKGGQRFSPEPDTGILGRRDEIIARMRQLVPARPLGDGVITDPDALRVYESDGLTAYRQLPLLVVLPETVEQVSKVLAYCHENQIKVVPRGAGTSLSGGALPLADAVTLGMGKFNKILEVDYDNRAVVAQPGVSNLGISKAVAPGRR